MLKSNIYLPIFHISLDFSFVSSIHCVATKGKLMKMRKYEDIAPSKRTNFTMVYYHAGRILTHIETHLKQAYGNHLPIKQARNLTRMQHKLEQMVAWYKQVKSDLAKEYRLKKIK